MKNNNRVFILTELILGALVIIVAVAMLRDNTEKILIKSRLLLKTQMIISGMHLNMDSGWLQKIRMLRCLLWEQRE